MHVGEDQVRVARERYGVPRDVPVEQEILPWEMDLIERVCGVTRFHDVTIFILRGQEMALIHKPSEPPGAFWAPTGGLFPGEGLADAVRREAWKETGLQVEPSRYVLRMQALFTCGSRRRPWTSHVFLADHVSGEPDPVDTCEVESAAPGFPSTSFREQVAPVLLDSGWGRFCYRLRISDVSVRAAGAAAAGRVPAVDGGPAPRRRISERRFAWNARSCSRSRRGMAGPLLPRWRNAWHSLTSPM